jgi:hypothetical protein
LEFKLFKISVFIGQKTKNICFNLQLIYGRDWLLASLEKLKGFKHAESVLSALYIGAIFIAIGVIYYIHLPNSLFLDVINFFNGLTLARVPDTQIYLPAPIAPAQHADLYLAAFQFCLIIGIVVVVVLALRFLFDSPINRKAETISNVVFWLGVSYLIATYLVDGATINKWFVFWIGVIIIFGLSLIARAFALLAKRHPEKTVTTTSTATTTTTATT